VAAGSDVIVHWGIDHLDQCLSALEFSGRAIAVSHGASEWTEQLLATSSGRGERVGVSRAAAARFPPGPRTVIHNGAEESRCAPTLSRNEVRRLWGIAADDIVVGYLGRMSPEKNPLASARAVQALGPPYRSVYVGDGVAMDAIREGALALDPRAVIAGARDDVGNALQAFDVFVLASPNEGFSLALVEAWLCGAPVVATAVGCVPELEEEFGPMVARVPINPSAEQLAAAVQTALSQSHRRVVQNGQRIARQHLTAEVFGRNWTNYLLRGAPQTVGERRGASPTCANHK
jgi:glycosyltransferase involved in cell wall biosynthesis